MQNASQLERISYSWNCLMPVFPVSLSGLQEQGLDGANSAACALASQARHTATVCRRHDGASGKAVKKGSGIFWSQEEACTRVPRHAELERPSRWAGRGQVLRAGGGLRCSPVWGGHGQGSTGRSHCRMLSHQRLSPAVFKELQLPFQSFHFVAWPLAPHQERTRRNEEAW